MALTDVATKYRYEGNGVTDSFAFPAKPFSASSLVVQIITRATDAVVETLGLTTHYTVTLAVDDESATVTVTDAAKIPSALQDIFIVRTLGATQSVELPRGTTFDTVAVENALDKLTALHQQQTEQIDRSIKAPMTEDGTLSLDIPTPTERASKFLSFDAEGNITVAEGSTGGVAVSVAMTPVVGATTLSDARAGLGLGALAVLNTVGTTQIDDGSVTGAKLASGGITSSQLRTAISDETGQGSLVFANLATLTNATLTSPTLATPALGVATATSINFGDEALSVYDEGTWTPVIEGSTTAGTPTHTVQTGKYTKIGNIVVIEGIITWTALSGAVGNLRIGGLPFYAATPDIPVTIVASGMTVPASTMIAAMISFNQKINLYSNAGGDTSLLAIDTAGTLRIRATYITT